MDYHRAPGLSSSLIVAYYECPAKAAYHIEGRKHRPHPSLLRGGLVHEFVAEYMAHLAETRNEIDPDWARSRMNEYKVRAMREGIGDGLALFEMALWRTVDNAFLDVSEIETDASTGHLRVMVEQPFCVDEKWRRCELGDPRTAWRIRPDLLMSCMDIGSRTRYLRMVDWKSHVAPPDSPSDWRQTAKERNQALLYATVLDAIHHVPVRYSYFFLGNGMATMEESFAREVLDDARDFFDRVRRDIGYDNRLPIFDEGKWAATPDLASGGVCASCEYANVCSAFAAELKRKAHPCGWPGGVRPKTAQARGKNFLASRSKLARAKAQHKALETDLREETRDEAMALPGGAVLGLYQDSYRPRPSCAHVVEALGEEGVGEVDLHQFRASERDMTGLFVCDLDKLAVFLRRERPDDAEELLNKVAPERHSTEWGIIPQDKLPHMKEEKP